MKHPKEDHHPTHPDMRTDAPGRIPESLINAAIDGELSDEMQREIAHALRYDPLRKQELLDTADAINALQMPIVVPDLTDGILSRANRHHRFIPSSWRRRVRTGRIGIAAALLVTLMVVAGLQRAYPRLTTLASHPTPVHNIEQAVGLDADQLATHLSKEVRTIRATVAPMADLLTAPGRTDQHFELTLAATPRANRFPSRLSGDVRLISFERGATLISIAHQRDMHAGPAYLNGSLDLLGSSEMLGWIYRSRHAHSRIVRSAPRSSQERETTELDVPALP